MVGVRGQLRGFGLGSLPLQGPALRPCLWGSRTKQGAPALPRPLGEPALLSPERALVRPQAWTLVLSPAPVSQWLLHCSGKPPGLSVLRPFSWEMVEQAGAAQSPGPVSAG